MNMILVPTDFSDAAKNALDYAINIAKRIKGEILLMNAYSIPRSGSSVMIDVSDVLKQDSIKKLQEEKQRIESSLGNIKLSLVSKNGFMNSSIASAIAENEISFVIMGTTGASGIKETFIGSNTASLIKEINIPLIVVPKDFKGSKIANITLSTDLNHLKSSNPFKPLKTIMNGDGPHISIINVSEDLRTTDPSKFVNEALDLDDLFFGTDHSFKFVENSDVEKGILEFTNDNHSDLLVVISRKRNFFETLFHKSISKKLAMHSDTPMMILND